MLQENFGPKLSFFPWDFCVRTVLSLVHENKSSPVLSIWLVNAAFSRFSFRCLYCASSEWHLLFAWTFEFIPLNSGTISQSWLRAFVGLWRSPKRTSISGRDVLACLCCDSSPKFRKLPFRHRIASCANLRCSTIFCRTRPKRLNLHTQREWCACSKFFVELGKDSN